MPKNVYKALLAADDLAVALDENEPSIAIDMTNVEKATVSAFGTFGGGTVTVQVSADGTNWASSGLTLTAAGKVDLTIPCKQMRVNVTGGTGASITCQAVLRTLD